jgi:membrane protein YdbS with pleckstrin-like domain
VVEEKTNATEIKISRDIIANLRPNEKIIWCGKPLFRLLSALWTGNNIYLLIMFITPFTLVIGAVVIAQMEYNVNLLLYLPHECIYAFCAFPFILIYFLNLLILITTQYVLTNKRLIILRGPFATHLRFIDLDKILHIDMKIGRLERMFGAGSIHIGLQGLIYHQMDYRISSAYSTSRETLSSVKNPFEVQKLIKNAIEQNKLEKTPPLTIIDAEVAKIQMLCPKCKSKLEFPILESDINIRCPVCSHVFAQEHLDNK